MSNNSRQRIAILGGGVGAITAAWALTESPEARERFDVTVYQLGWRLGGKGASGRNAAHGQRIEEHGLHVWLGWYRNAFALLDRCYEELARPPEAPLARLEQAFVAHDYVGVAHDANSHGRRFWMLEFPRTARSPGDDEPQQLREYVEIVLRLLARQLHASLLRPVRPDQAPERRALDWLQPRLLRGLASKLRRTALAQVLAHLDVERLRPWLSRTVAQVPDHEHELDGLLLLLDFCAATLRGLVHDRALLFGLDVLDRWDLREWLRRHGARPSTVDAPFVKAWYDLAFAYECGDTARPNFAAGAALRAILRTGLCYRGAIFWKMQAGMGDVVFAPLYELLRRRGVRFEFFHRVDELEVEALATPSTTAKHRVTRVRMTVQATPKSGEYHPLVDVDGLPCWPSAPLLDQLVESEALARDVVDLECPASPWPGVGERVLEQGRDFDTVIFGISLGAVAQLCPGLIERDPAWRRMVDEVATVATQAVQLWMEPSLAELGWLQPSPILDAYDDPFNTWADMSFLLPREAWSGSRPPRSLAYLVGPLHEHESQLEDQRVEAVRARARRWLDRAGTGLWPATARGGGYPSFDSSVVVSEYARANVAGSERYVQSLRGTTKHRLFVESCGVEGLYPVGDWLNTGINSGDVEAATITGLQAARAILGHSRPIEGEGDGWGRHEVARHTQVIVSRSQRLHAPSKSR